MNETHQRLPAPATMNERPIFVAVGRVNKGKSSVVSTLAEASHVAISKIPGTTRVCTRYPIVADNKVLFSVVDTPGFEEAPATLAWLKQEGEPGQAAKLSPEEKRQRVKAFVAHHKTHGGFEEERALLEPLLDGAAIIYVVDVSKPFREHYRSEMEVLSWTGQPAMALLNAIGESDAGESWLPALNAYFPLVRTFNAHHAGFAKRVELVRQFGDIHPLGHPIWRKLPRH